MNNFVTNKSKLPQDGIQLLIDVITKGESDVCKPCFQDNSWMKRLIAGLLVI